MQSSVLNGIDVFIKKKQHKRLTIVTNNAALTSQGVLSRVALLQNNFQLQKIFTPEHGITITGADGVAQKNSTDAVTDLPVISLYNQRLQPTEEELKDIDAVLFDLPDVGCRFYTYLWTMTYVMEACAQYNKPFIVLDRPNPIGALIEHAEGPMLDEAHCSSFIGRWNIPIKHSCTLGELALYFAATRLPQLNIEVVNVKNYQRHQTAVHDFAFTPTSPAIQTIQTALLYPGMGLLEGVNVNEGRGTEFPFMQFGAPWINEQELAAALQSKIHGVQCLPVQYMAASGMYAHELCHGVRLQIINLQEFKAVQTGITILQTILQLYPNLVAERFYKTNVNPTGEKHLDKLLGINNSFLQLQNGTVLKTDVFSQWQQQIKPYLLYS